MNGILTVQTDEIGADFVGTLKSMFKSERIVIVPEKEYEDLTREKHNNEYLEKLAKSFQEIEDGKGITMTLEQMAAMENE